MTTKPPHKARKREFNSLLLACQGDADLIWIRDMAEDPVGWLDPNIDADTEGEPPAFAPDYWKKPR